MYRYRSEHRSPLGDELLPHLPGHLGSSDHPARYRIFNTANNVRFMYSKKDLAKPHSWYQLNICNQNYIILLGIMIYC